MKKFLFIVLLCSSVFWLFGCKNEDDLLKEGKYQEAYDMCKDQDKKDEILKENKYAVIIKNCKEISELDDTTDITFIADLEHMERNVVYVFCVNKKKTLGDGYYQDHYYYFRADGANTGDAFYSDIKKITDGGTNDDLPSNVSTINNALGTDYEVGYSRGAYYLKNDEIGYVSDALFLLASPKINNVYKEDQKIIDNLNNLIHNKIINNVSLIKK